MDDKSHRSHAFQGRRERRCFPRTARGRRGRVSDIAWRNLEEGVAIGALSLVKRDCEAFGIYFGSPARKVGIRKRRILELEKQLMSERQL